MRTQSHGNGYLNVVKLRCEVVTEESLRLYVRGVRFLVRVTRTTKKESTTFCGALIDYGNPLACGKFVQSRRFR